MSTTVTATTALDVADLQRRVQAVYQQVAEEPRRAYHFELGRELALRLGYPKDLLDEIPTEALESFAGVGPHLTVVRCDVGHDLQAVTIGRNVGRACTRDE